ncbi:MAG TPA: hypothetical protein VFW59_04425, partial [Gallionella sp.]|nr:hypothetical protein [Gallionella sp.]
MDARWIEALINQAVPALATLIAAFVGAWLAFLLTDRAHVRLLKNQNAAAVNQALFTMLRQYNALKNVQDQLVDPVRNDPGKFIKMQSLAPLAYATLHPEFDSLSFLLETEQRGLL